MTAAVIRVGWAWLLMLPVLANGETSGGGTCPVVPPFPEWMYAELSGFTLPWRTMQAVGEIGWCYRQEATCQDYAMCGGERDCNTDLGFYIGDAMTDLKTPLFVQCPRSCGLCGPQRESIQRERFPLSPLVADLVRGPCEDGWKYADGACFILQYVALGEWMDQAPTRTWPEAERACNALGAHLATVDTPTQSNVVFDLIKQRPSYLTQYWEAWIGLRRHRIAKCTEEAGPWTWVAAENATEPRYMDESFFKGGDCKDEDVSPTYVAMSVTVTHGRFWVRNEPCAERRTWVCSKPARFRDITSGSCEDYGLVPILEARACEVAAQVLFGVEWPVVKHPLFSWGSCTFSFGGPGLTVPLPGVRVSAIFDNFNHGLCGPASPRPAPGARAPAPAPVPLLELQESIKTQKAAPVTPAVLAVTSVTAGLVLALVAIKQFHRFCLRGRGPRRCGCGAGRPGLACARRWRRLQCEGGTDAREAELAVAVAASMRQRRVLFASGMAVCLLAYHLFELVRLTTAAEAACRSPHSPAGMRDWLAVVHLASLSAAAAVLLLPWRDSIGSGASDAADSRRCHKAVRALVALMVLVGIAETWLAGHQALLMESRFWRQIGWRFLLGACVTLPQAAAGIALYTISQIFLYWQQIPDGMIFSVGSSRGGLLLSQGCNQLWPADAAIDFAEWLSQIKQQLGEAAFPEEFEPVLSTVSMFVERKTDLSEFVAMEVALVTITVIGLFLLQWIMSREIAKSLQLHSTEEQFWAVLRILETLCDATVQVAHDCRIIQRAPKLDRMLHFSNTPTAMEGTDLRTVIASEEDRVAFEADLRSKCPGNSDGQHMPEERPGVSDALYLNFRDGCETQVPVQMLVTPFTGITGEHRFICGITELGEHKQHAGEDNMMPTDSLEMVCPVVRRSRSSSRASTGSGSGNSRNSKKSKRSRNSDTAVFDANRYFVEIAADCRVLRATEEFEALLGLTGSTLTSLSQVMENPAEFSHWLQERIIGFQHDTAMLPCKKEVSFSTYTVCVQNGMKKTVMSKMLCEASFPAVPVGSSLDLTDYQVILRVRQTSKIKDRGSLVKDKKSGIKL